MASRMFELKKQFHVLKKYSFNISELVLEVSLNALCNLHRYTLNHLNVNKTV